jgi:multisubunit Na+/H+ antiporter MnhB subunit
MTLSEAAEQGRNASSLNLYDALGSAIFIGVAGSIFAALHPTGNLALTFGVVEASMAVVALLAVITIASHRHSAKRVRACLIARSLTLASRVQRMGR